MTYSYKDQMVRWRRDKPVLALMGEFSAGKSTLLNMLLSERLIPTNVTATDLPILWLTYGTAPKWQGVYPDGQGDGAVAGVPDWAMLDRYALVEITIDNPLLKLCDVVDSPGISDHRIAAGTLQNVADAADCGIWCTAANQAWRQSEKAAWADLPARLRETSILAVTRADQLGSAADLAKVVKRLKADAGPMFASVLPVSAKAGMSAISHGTVTDPAGWQESGADALLREIKNIIQIAQGKVRERTAESAEDPEFIHHTAPQTRAVIAFKDGVAQGGTKSETLKKVTFLSKLEQCRDAIYQHLTGDNSELQMLMQGVVSDGCLNIDYQRALNQVEQEIEDFSKSTWCRLDEA